MKNFTFKLSFLPAFMLLTVSSFGQATWTDDFSISHDYLTAGVAGTIWDALVVNDTMAGAEAPVARIYKLDTDTVPGTLTIKTSDTYWGGAYCNGVLLCKVLPADVDFTAIVQIVGGDLTSWNGPLDYLCPGLLVRNPDVYAGDFVDVFAFDRDNWSAVHLFEDWDDDTETELPTADAVSVGDNPWIKLERSGNDFITYFGADGENWTELGSTTRDDLAGMDLQVGISHSMNTANIGNTQYDNFKLDCPSCLTGIKDVDMNDNLNILYKSLQRNIVISMDNGQMINAVSVVGMDGRLITRQTVNTNHLEIAAPQNGLYIVLVESNGNTLAKKIIVQ